MAKLFLVCQRSDERLAGALQLRLALQHSFRHKVPNKVSGDWRTAMRKALADSDAVIFLLSERGLGSSYVLSQMGAARVHAALKGQLMLPVVVGDVEVPEFIRDLQYFKLASDRDGALDRLANELTKAIMSVPPTPRIFVSHRYIDEALAAALVSLIEAAFEVQKWDLRCTSVQPYALQPGERVSERVRGDINGAELVIGLIGPDTAESRYVLFELGASWGRGVPTFPALVRGATRDDVPGPLGERLAVALGEEARCLQFVDDIQAATSLQRRQGVAGRVAEEARKLAQLASTPERRGRARPNTKKSNTKRSKMAALPAQPDSDMH